MEKACQIRHTNSITFSKNVFIPLTNICRNDCGYCTFRQDPHDPKANILMAHQDVMKIIRHGHEQGCKEALFTFGERADENFHVQEALRKIGFETILDYLYVLCEETLNQTALLPHSNPGILKKPELKMLREVNASLGLMLETTSERIMQTIAHENSPGKSPKERIKTIENAGKLKIPFTTGLLIGIGETIEERAESLLKIRRIQNKYGHIQEIIIQNFRKKPGIVMADYPEPPLADMIRTVAATRILFPDCGVQVPPNLNPETSQIFLLTGTDDWGGVSPITPDHVNPEAPWPEVAELKYITKNLGFDLKERLPVYDKFLSPDYLSDKVLEKIDR
ncbi:MAG TPA: 7,8-didemethyl-8-hydroxy-5-deazariboflavin synthase CofG [Methanobacteriaceae archaeon]|nr:7,8-didemethyl-8-hydroxy-5-deazariboflavin synthase CofG [Methanobacteriaceae archaeon]